MGCFCLPRGYTRCPWPVAQVIELKAELTKLGLDTAGKKADLVARLSAHRDGQASAVAAVPAGTSPERSLTVGWAANQAPACASGGWRSLMRFSIALLLSAGLRIRCWHEKLGGGGVLITSRTRLHAVRAIERWKGGVSCAETSCGLWRRRLQDGWGLTGSASRRVRIDPTPQ